MPEEEYTVPLGKAEVKRVGRDLTIISYSRTLLLALQAAEELEREGDRCRSNRPADPRPSGYGDCD